MDSKTQSPGGSPSSSEGEAIRRLSSTWVAQAAPSLDVPSHRPHQVAFMLDVPSQRTRTSSKHPLLCTPAKSAVRTESMADEFSTTKSTDIGSSRTTLTLDALYEIRGTPSSTLLSWGGAILRSTAGGIGHSFTGGLDTYSKSVPVQRLGIFLSHSWHAKWFPKYLSLLMYFNSLPAVVAALVTSLLVATLKRGVTWTGDSFLARCFRSDDELNNTLHVHYLCLPIGGVVFLFVLFTWHSVREKLRCCTRCRSKSIFLDKVCIHQTDIRLKTLGIRSIGAILDKSDTLLIAWDPTYFNRLWCMFELAAFRVHHPHKDISLFPIDLGVAIAGFSFLCLVSEAARLIWISAHRLEGREEFFQAFEWVFVLQSICLAVTVRRFGRSLDKLREQLEQFSVRKAECFCCSNGHVTEFGQPIPCDRKVVYESIAHWHGNKDGNFGLDKFDKMIHHDLKDEMSGLRNWLLIPYRIALMCGLWNTLVWLDFERHLIHVSYYFRIMMVVERFFFNFPLLVAWAVWLGSRLPFPAGLKVLSASRLTRLTQILWQLLMVLFIAVCLILYEQTQYWWYRCMFEKEGSSLHIFAYFLVKFGGTVFLYCREVPALRRPGNSRDTKAGLRRLPENEQLDVELTSVAKTSS